MICAVLLLGCLLQFVSICSAVPIDNEVLGDPFIDCHVDSVTVEFRTKKPFFGRLFVRGLSANSHCSEDLTRFSYSINEPNRNASIRVRYGTCDVRRERSANPRGVYMYTTVVIQFHPIFLTTTDRVYRVNCFYKEAVQTVSNGLEVSVLSTGAITAAFEMPICTYSIRKETANGPMVRFAKVGDRVVHRWECESPGITEDENPYGMLVHSCEVDDERGNAVQVVDEHGCSIDPYILGHLSYNDNLLVAHREAHVFKFADQNQLSFSCQIRLCLKSMETCEGMTPPKCPQLKNKRSADDILDIDLTGNLTENVGLQKYRPVDVQTTCFDDLQCVTCSYGLRSSNQSTLPIHNWSCESNYVTPSEDSRQETLLHSCVLFDNSGAAISLIDKYGCVNEQKWLTGLTYDNGNIEAEIDAESFQLSCRMRVCLDGNSVACKRPKCRSRRSLMPSRPMDDNEVDVHTASLLVLDKDEADLIFRDKLNDESGENVCLSYIGTAVLIASSTVFFLSMFVSCFVIVSRRRAPILYGCSF